jgi:hypothetical protein
MFMHCSSHRRISDGLGIWLRTRAGRMGASAHSVDGCSRGIATGRLSLAQGFGDDPAGEGFGEVVRGVVWFGSVVDSWWGDGADC